MGGFPGRRQFFDLLAAFGGERKFHISAMSASLDRHQTIPLQGAEIPQERGSFHPKNLAQFRHIRRAGGVQREQNGALGAANPLSAHFRIEQMRHHPRDPAEIEANAIPAV